MFWRDKAFDVLPALSVRGQELRQSLRLVTVAWMWGVVWMTCVGGDQMRAFARMLGFNDFAFGVMGAIPFIATLGQLPAAIIVERTGLRKHLFLNTQVVARLLWIPIALVPFVFCPGEHGSIVAVTAVLVLMVITNFLAHLSAPPWTTWMGDLVPRRIRGRYFARRTQLSALIQIAAIIGISVIMDHVNLADLPQTAAAQPRLLIAVAGIFIVGSICGTVDILLFRRIREIRPPRHDDNAKPSFDFTVAPRKDNSIRSGIVQVGRYSYRALDQILLDPLRDRAFRNYVCHGSFIMFSATVAGWFYWLQARDHLGFNSLATNGLFLVLAPIAGILTASRWGKLIDRWGRRPVLIVSTFATILSVLPWLFASTATPSPQFVGDAINNVAGLLGSLFGHDGMTCLDQSAMRAVGSYLLVTVGVVIGGIAWTGWGLAVSAVVLGFSDGTGRNKFVAASSVLINVGGTMGGIIGGILTQNLKGIDLSAWGLHWNNYQVMFMVSIVVRAASIAWLYNMPDPGAGKVRDLLRTWSENVYNNVASRLLYPLRIFGWPTRGDTTRRDRQE